jgi:hypothetical protein
MTTANIKVLGRVRENFVRDIFIGLTMDSYRFENIFQQRCAQDFIVRYLTSYDGEVYLESRTSSYSSGRIFLT